MSFISVFDVLGPNMIGPSSSHTAGAAVIGYLAQKMINGSIQKVTFTLYGSFAKTYRGHGTDKALVAGILGMKSDDERIRNSLDIARQEGLEFNFRTVSIPGAHPNTARIILTGEQGTYAELCGASIGGGNILVTEINGLEVSVTGQHNTLVVLHHDKPGTIAAVTNFMAYSGLNIGNFRLARPRKGGEAVMTIEVDGEIPGVLFESLKILPNIINVILIRAI